MKTVTSILNARAGDRSSEISKLSSKLKEKSSDLTRESKYSDRASLDKNGVGAVYDRVQSTISGLKQNDINIQITSVRLDNEKLALGAINDVMRQFHIDIGRTKKIYSDEQVADDALSKINQILKKQDNAGRYIFGGNDQLTDPLSKLDKSGNRISVDLTQNSNVINGLILNNYSDTSENTASVEISSDQTVRESFLYAGGDAIVQTIAYLNMVKTSDGTDAYKEKMAKVQEDQARTFEKFRISIDIEIAKIGEAHKRNDINIQNAYNTNTELFTGNVIERADQVKNLQNSLEVSMKLSQISNNSFKTLLENTRV